MLFISAPLLLTFPLFGQSVDQQIQEILDIKHVTGDRQRTTQTRAPGEPLGPIEQLPTVDAQIFGDFSRSREIFSTSSSLYEKPWQLCEAWASGTPSNDLVWMEAAHRLFPVLQNASLYSVHLTPGQLTHQQTNISLAMYIESMSSFKAQTMDFEVDMYLALSWFDRRLRHNCTHPILVTKQELLSLIWSPDLYFVNSKFAYLQEVTTPNNMMLVYPDGMVFKTMRVYVTLACTMNLVGFPMDTQSCDIKIQSFAYVREVLNLLWHVDPSQGYPLAVNTEIQLNDMEVIDRQWKYCNMRYKMFRGYGNWSCLTATIVMQRKITFHIIQTYLPTGLLVVISWLSFWLDPRSAPARVSLTITTLLTLTTMSNGARQDLPQVSYIKALDVWLSFCTAYVFCVLLEYTLVSFYVTRKTTRCHHVRMVDKIAKNVKSTVATAMNHRFTKEQPPESKSPWTVRTALSNPTALHKSATIASDYPSPGINPSSMYNDLNNVSGSPIAPPPSCDQNHNVPPSSARANRPDLETADVEPETLFEHIRDFVIGTICYCCTSRDRYGRVRFGSHCVDRDTLRHPCAICAQRWETIGKRIDKASRVMFPCTFLVFVLYYWTSHLCGQCRLGQNYCGNCTELSDGYYMPNVDNDAW